MTRRVALLRGVNVGGHRRVSMTDLRAGLRAAGLADVVTYLQSGNAVFSGGPGDEVAVAALVRSVVQEACGVDAEVVVRDGAQLADVVARLPWPARAATDPALLHVLFLSAESASVEAARIGPEEAVRAEGREVFVWYGAGSGRSRLAVQTPGVVATARNWRSVVALAELSAG